MNRGAFQIMMGGSPASLWSLDNMRPDHPLLPSSSSSSTASSSSFSSILPQYLQLPPNYLRSMAPWHDNQELPESWSQLLLGGLVEEDDSYSFTPFQNKKMDNWQDQMIYPSANSRIVDVKQELSDKEYFVYGHASEEIQAPRSSWSQILPNSSPRSCVTTSFNSSMLDFSNKKAETRHHHLDHTSQECNSTPTGSPYKKARVTSTQPTFKVRKEKLGDRITALHQIVSPFGKTDTASVLLEAIGYIRFLQSQIEALSSPYLASGSAGNMKQPAAQGERNCIFPEHPGQLLNANCMQGRGAPVQDGIDQLEPKKDLRSRGLCLVPVSFTLHVGNDNGADYWAPTFGGVFR